MLFNPLLNIRLLDLEMIFRFLEILILNECMRDRALSPAWVITKRFPVNINGISGILSCVLILGVYG